MYHYLFCWCLYSGLNRYMHFTWSLNGFCFNKECDPETNVQAKTDNKVANKIIKAHTK